MAPTELIRLVRELGPVWGVTLVCTLLLFSLAQHRWTSAGIEGLVSDPLMRIAVCVFIIGVPLYLLTYYFGFARRFGLPAPFRQGEVGVIVAQIPGDIDHRLQQTYAQAIRAFNVVDSEVSDSIKIRLLERPLPDDPDRQHQEALRLGRRLRASFVLRAIRVEGGFQAWLTIVRSQDFGRHEAHLGRINEQQVAELDKLPLPMQMTVLARCASALYLYSREDYETAAQLLREIVVVPELLPGSPSRAYFLFILGNCYLNGRFRDPATFLARAVATYDDVLTEWSQEANPIGWLDAITNKIAALLLKSSDLAANAAEIEQLSQLALSDKLRKTDPYRWAKLLTLRASLSLSFPLAFSSDEAIDRLSSARNAVSRHKDAYDWAWITRNRGMVYGRVNQKSETKETQAKAVADLRAALKVFKRSKYPYDWGNTILTLASIYVVPPDEDMFAKGLDYLESLNTLFTKEDYPSEWAQLQRISGTAFWIASLANEDLLPAAIEFYEAALEVHDAVRFPVEYARTVGALGLAYSRGKETEDRIKLAIHYTEEAVKIFEQEKFESDAENGRSIAEEFRQKLREMNADITDSGPRCHS
jgi:tetratricopeptide (TPR) repeat protein